MRVGPHVARILGHKLPVIVQDLVADLVVGEVAVLLGPAARLPGSRGRAADLVHVRVGEGEAPAVGGDPQHQLVPGGAVLQVEPHGGVNVEVLPEVVL